MKVDYQLEYKKQLQANILLVRSQIDNEDFILKIKNHSDKFDRTPEEVRSKILTDDMYAEVNPEMGFSINEDFDNKYDPTTKSLKKTNSKVFSVWIDEFEGGEAYESDWDYVDDFKSFEEAMKYITDVYGEVEKLAVY